MNMSLTSNIDTVDGIVDTINSNVNTTTQIKTQPNRGILLGLSFFVLAHKLGVGLCKTQNCGVLMQKKNRNHYSIYYKSKQ